MHPGCGRTADHDESLATRQVHADEHPRTSASRFAAHPSKKVALAGVAEAKAGSSQRVRVLGTIVSVGIVYADAARSASPSRMRAVASTER